MSGGKGWARYSAKARAMLQPSIDRGDAVCSKCGRMVTPGQLWDVDHVTPRDIAPHRVADPSNWAIAHRSCNRKAGAVYGNRKRGHEPRPRIIPQPSREW